MNWHRFHFYFRLLCIGVIVILVAHHLISRKNRLSPQRVIELDRKGDPGSFEFTEADRRLGTEKRTAGNTEKARVVAVRMKESVGALPKSIPKGSDQPKVYCLLHKQYCIFLIHLAGLHDLTKAEQNALSEAIWPRAQELAVEALGGYPTVGLGLKDENRYGPVLIGGREKEPIYTQNGGSYVFYPYFAGEPSLKEYFAGRSTQED